LTDSLLVLLAAGGVAAFFLPGAVPRGWWVGLAAGVAFGTLALALVELHSFVEWSRGNFGAGSGTAGQWYLLAGRASLHGFAASLVGWAVDTIGGRDDER